MSFLASLRPIMRGSSSVTVTLTAGANDALSVLVTSKLDKLDPDTTDEGRAALQSALALPMRIVIPQDADADAEFLKAMTRYDAARSPALDDFQSVLDTLAQAQQTAKAAAAKKATTTKTSPAKTEKAASASKPAAPAAATGTTVESPDATDDDEPAEGQEATSGPSEASDAASAEVSPASPAPASASTLFD